MQAMKRILVVDDDPIVGQSFDRVLSGKGYAVISAANAAQALDRIAREDYDLVYADIKMPGESGIELARRIRASRPWMPVVIITGYGTADDETQAREMGVSAFLHKPLTPQVIEDTADELTIEPAAATTAAPPEPTQAATESTARLVARNVALFFLAPVIGLAYIVIGPLVGLGMLAWFGGKTVVEWAKGKRG